MTTSKPIVKLVYFNRRETDQDCDKIDDPEIFALRNSFEARPDEFLYVITYYAPTKSGDSGLFKTVLRATSEMHARAKFNAQFPTTDWRLRIQSVKLQEHIWREL